MKQFIFLILVLCGCLQAVDAQTYTGDDFDRVSGKFSETFGTDEATLYADSMILMAQNPNFDYVFYDSDSESEEEAKVEEGFWGRVSRTIKRWFGLEEEVRAEAESGDVGWNKDGVRWYEEYGITQKAANLQALGNYDESIDYVGQVIDDVNILENKYFLSYIRILSRIEIGQYRLALQEAQVLYKSASEELELNKDAGASVRQTSIRGVCFAFVCMAVANKEQGNYQESLDNYYKAEQVILSDTASVVRSALYGQLLDVQTYIMQMSEFVKDPNVALKMVENYNAYFNQFREEAKDNDIYENLFVDDYLLYMYIFYGHAYSRLNDIPRAHMAFNSADSLLEMYDIQDVIKADYYKARALYYSQLKDYELSREYSDSAMYAYRRVGKPKVEIDALVSKMEALHHANMPDSIYPIASRIIELKDTLNRELLQSSANEMQTMMNVKELENDKKELERKQQVWALVAVVAIFIAIMIVMWLRHRQSQKEKAILAQQKELLKQQVDEQTKELREQNETIEKANKSITDSINYALHIQKSILPNFEIYSGNENQPSGAFCFYQPCHIVSGDFYWAAKRGRNTLFACCDCTGHGVPGGFMSMLGTSVLGEVARMPGTEDLAEFLEQAHEQLIKTLEQSGDKDSIDGMDMAIIEFNPDESTISIASASRTSMLYINSEWIQHKGVKRGIGERSFDRNSLPFTSDTYKVSKSDRVFLFSDGYPDQFGGPRGKKLGNKGVVEILKETEKLQYDGLKSYISDKYWEWRGDCEQLDDISMLVVEV